MEYTWSIWVSVVIPIVEVTLTCTSTCSSPSIEQLGHCQRTSQESSTLLHCYQFWSQTSSKLTFGRFWQFFGRKRETLHGFYPLNSDSLAMKHDHVVAGTNYLGMSSEVIVQRSRCPKLHRTYYSEIHHFHQGSQDLCFRWLPMTK